MDSKTSTSSHFHLDLRNPTNSETKPHKIGGDYWVDAEGKAVGNKYVNPRVVIFDQWSGISIETLVSFDF